MVRRTKAEAMETRTRILDAAEQVFHRKGVLSASLNDIASEAGVTRGAIYWHFKNKEGLMAAVINEVTSAWIEQIAVDHHGVITYRAGFGTGGPSRWREVVVDLVDRSWN